MRSARAKIAVGVLFTVVGLLSSDNSWAGHRGKRVVNFLNQKVRGVSSSPKRQRLGRTKDVNPRGTVDGGGWAGGLLKNLRSALEDGVLRSLQSAAAFVDGADPMLAIAGGSQRLSPRWDTRQFVNDGVHAMASYNQRGFQRRKKPSLSDRSRAPEPPAPGVVARMAEWILSGDARRASRQRRLLRRSRSGDGSQKPADDSSIGDRDVEVDRSARGVDPARKKNSTLGAKPSMTITADLPIEKAFVTALDDLDDDVIAALEKADVTNLHLRWEGAISVRQPPSVPRGGELIHIADESDIFELPYRDFTFTITRWNQPTMTVTTRGARAFAQLLYRVQPKNWNYGISRHDFKFITNGPASTKLWNRLEKKHLERLHAFRGPNGETIHTVEIERTSNERKDVVLFDVTFYDQSQNIIGSFSVRPDWSDDGPDRRRISATQVALDAFAEL